MLGSKLQEKKKKRIKSADLRICTVSLSMSVGKVHYTNNQNTPLEVICILVFTTISSIMTIHLPSPTPLMVKQMHLEDL